ncbi:hypothetical protein [Streptomyces avicenniae]|uniref:hypothetical protein n=1 Tax=Streptomyces avicenniae TaxID=500153 RepID=UPI00069B2B87|nr:hypothetical protein [Streptomyces avicenniae]
MMSFFAKLVSSTEESHLYRVFLDDGGRVAHLVLDTEARVITSADAEGNQTRTMQLSVESGNMEPSTDPEIRTDFERDDDGRGISREEFRRVSANIAGQYLKSGTAPEGVAKFYG